MGPDALFGATFGLVWQHRCCDLMSTLDLCFSKQVHSVDSSFGRYHCIPVLYLEAISGSDRLARVSRSAVVSQSLWWGRIGLLALVERRFDHREASR